MRMTFAGYMVSSHMRDEAVAPQLMSMPAQEYLFMYGWLLFFI
jgi:hypothetical protein